MNRPSRLIMGPLDPSPASRPPWLGVAVGLPGMWLTRVTVPEARSRRKTFDSARPVWPGTRLGAVLVNATKRPSALTEGKVEAPAAVSEGGWPAGGREMACSVEGR